MHQPSWSGCVIALLQSYVEDAHIRKSYSRWFVTAAHEHWDPYVTERDDGYEKEEHEATATKAVETVDTFSTT